MTDASGREVVLGGDAFRRHPYRRRKADVHEHPTAPMRTCEHVLHSLFLHCLLWTSNLYSAFDDNVRELPDAAGADSPA